MRSAVKISIRPKVKKALIFIGAMVILMIIVLAILPLLHGNSATPAGGTTPDAQAAVHAASAFYTLDGTVDPELWATHVCAYSTEAGCLAIKNFFAPSVEATVRKNRIQTGCVVTPLRLVSVQGNARIWLVSVTITTPWPGLKNPIQNVYIEVENMNGIWLMNRILFQQEAIAYPTLTP
jgi:hypothetical protein